MGLRNGARLKVWECKKGNGNYYDARVSASKRNPNGDGYITDFSGYVRFVGQAAQEAANFKGGENVRVGEFEVTNNYNKEKNTTYTNYAIFTFVDDNGNGQTQAPAARQQNNNPSFNNIPAGADDGSELPFT